MHYDKLNCALLPLCPCAFRWLRLQMLWIIYYVVTIGSKSQLHLRADLARSPARLYLVSLTGELSTLRISILIRYKEGYAVARAHPERISSAEQWRGCDSYCQLLSGISLIFQYVKEHFNCESPGIEPEQVREWLKRRTCCKPANSIVLHLMANLVHIPRVAKERHSTGKAKGYNVRVDEYCSHKEQCCQDHCHCP